MLVLNRRIGETVMIADDISVTVLGVKGRQVRLGLVAPPTVPLHRKEIYDRILRERAAATPRVHTTGTLQIASCIRGVSTVHDRRASSKHISEHRDELRASARDE